MLSNPNIGWVVVFLAVPLAHSDSARAGAPANCAAVCKHLSECGLQSFADCTSTCSKNGSETEKGREMGRSLLQSTCAQLRQGVKGPSNHAPQISATKAGPRSTPKKSAGVASCAALCDRLAQCKLAPYKGCMEWCSKGQHPSREQTQSSCAQLAQDMRTDHWVCTAEAEWGSKSGIHGSVTTAPIMISGNGRTRAEAQMKALADCRAAATFSVANAQGSFDAQPSSWDQAGETHSCRVTSCIPPK